MLGSIMALYSVLIFCTLAVVEVKTSSRASTSCKSDIMPCYNKSISFTDYYVENNTSEGTSSEPPPPVTPRRIRGRTQRPKKRNYSRKHPTRRRVSRRKIHRHSTRVLTLKPAVILLPPFESFADDKANKLDPFIINFSSKYNGSTPATETPTTESTVTMRTREHPRRTTTRRTTISPPKKLFFPQPHQFLLPPLPEQSNNNLDIEQPVPSENPKVEYSYATTVSYETASPVQNSSTSVNPFENLEKEYNDVLRLTGGNILEPVTPDETTANQLVENHSASTYSSSEQPVYDWSSSSSYNATPEAYYDNLSEEKYEYDQTLADNFDSSRNAFNVLNNTLLAPDVASLGMKIVTSKKGLEMVKEFTVANKSRAYADVSVYNKNDGNINLETAETGDFRLQAYDNQILSLEDTKEVPKEAYRMLKGTQKPFQICSGNQGYVADPASGCQVFYICLGRGAGEPMMCPNGTLFNQDFLVCDWWYNVECNG